MESSDAASRATCGCRRCPCRWLGSRLWKKLRIVNGPRIAQARAERPASGQPLPRRERQLILVKEIELFSRKDRFAVVPTPRPFRGHLVNLTESLIASARVSPGSN